MNTGEARAYGVTVQHLSGSSVISEAIYTLEHIGVSKKEVSKMTDTEYAEKMNEFKTYVENQEPGLVLDLSGVIKTDVILCPIGKDTNYE